MNVASRPVSTGKTRTCPHCKATILESLSICPGCMHHLRFDSEAAKRQVAATPALRVEGIIRHPPLEQPLEYYVIIAIRNDRGEEVTRQVVNVGALQAAEKRTFTLSVEVLPPQAPVPTKSTPSTTSAGTGTFKSPVPQPTAPVRPTTVATPASPDLPGATAGSGSSSAATGAGPGSSTSAVPRPGAPKPSAPAPSAAKPSAAGGSPAGAPSNPAATGNPPAPSNPAPTTSGSTKPASGYTLKPPSPGGPKRH
jgi:hypothetical protein